MRWIAIGVAVAAVLAAAGFWIATPRAGNEAVAVRVSDLAGGQSRYEGKAVSLVLEYDKRDPGDPVAERQTRSDCYLHDETGSILLIGGWQAWLEWSDAGSFSSDWLSVDAAGVWTVKTAFVHYDSAGAPYLEAPEEAEGE